LYGLSFACRSLLFITEALLAPAFVAVVRRDSKDVPAADWAEAYKRIDAGTKVAEVARQMCVKRQTLADRYAVRAEGVSRRGPKPLMGKAGEMRLVEWLQLHERIGKCVSLVQLKTVAMRIAQDIADPRLKGHRRWLDNFLGRWWQTLSVRKGEATERKRLWAVHPLTLAQYFAEIKKLLYVDGELRSASSVWACDEWGFDLMNMRDGRKVRAEGGNACACACVPMIQHCPITLLNCRPATRRCR
jgi:hypothetical protein